MELARKGICSRRWAEALLAVAAIACLAVQLRRELRAARAFRAQCREFDLAEQHLRAQAITEAAIRRAARRQHHD